MVHSEISLSQHDRRSEQTAIGEDVSKTSGSIRDFTLHTRQLAENQRVGKAEQESHPKNGGAINERGDPVKKTVNLTSEYGPNFQGLLAGTPEQAKAYWDAPNSKQEPDEFWRLYYLPEEPSDQAGTSNQQEYNIWNQWQGNSYGTDNSAQLYGSRAEASSQHVEVQVSSDSEDETPQALSPHGQGDQTQHYDQDYALMTQQELGISLAEKLHERYGKYDKYISEKKDIRAFLLNTDKLSREGLRSGYARIDQLEPENKHRGNLKLTMKNYAQEGVRVRR